jgi:hypothetical protein
LKELADIDPWNHPKMEEVVDDIAFRLRYQSSQLQTISDHLTQIRNEPLLALPSSSSSSSSNKNSSSTSSNNNNGTMMSRPYWWTHRQESQLLQEIETQQGQLRNLQRLYSDTHEKIVAQLPSTKTNLSSSSANLSETKKEEHLKLERFAKFRLFGEIYSRHALTIETFAEMVIGLRALRRPVEMDDTLQKNLLHERLGMLLLCDHVTLSCSTKPTATTPIVDADIPDIVEKAVTEASHLCEAQYLTAPSVQIKESFQMASPKNPMTALVVKPWLQYTLVELFKNNMAVTVERSDDGMSLLDDDDPERERFLHPIHVDITETSNEIRIDIHDQGGGIGIDIDDEENKSVENIFEFAQRRTKWDRMDDQQTYAMMRSPLRGLGVGLSMSRMMMEYFGGSLELEDRKASDTLEAGVTATIVLPKDSTISEKKIIAK